jgi:hypothetical protein
MAIFNNCYIYNPPEYGVYKMAKELEQNILLRISKIPPNVSSFCRILKTYGQTVTNSINVKMMSLSCARM